MAHDVFISYSSNDKEIAFQICSAIERSGLVCWIAPRDVIPGSKYAREIVSAIQNCSVMLLIFSESSNKSEHVENEIDIAFNEGKTIIPFKISDTEMSVELKYYLNKKHWIDGCPEPESHFEKLVEQISLSIPRRSKELREEEVFSAMQKILEDYKKDGSDISDDKITSLQNKFKSIFDKVGFQNMEFRKLSENSQPDVAIDEKSINNDAGRYSIFQNGAGEILIIISAKEHEPDNPRIVYDGGTSALLYRSRKSSIMLTNINPEARHFLREVDEVILVEIEDDEVLREYKVLMRNVKSLDHLLKLAEDNI